MRVIGFSGSRELLTEEAVEVERILWTLNGDGVVTGACIGLDEFVAEWFRNHRPKMHQDIIVPADRSRVNMKWIDDIMQEPNVDVTFMPKGSSYLDRNLEIVRRSNLLVAFPRERESHFKSQRSGTWQTIRRARPRIPVHAHVLSELVDRVNPA